MKRSNVQEVNVVALKKKIQGLNASVVKIKKRCSVIFIIQSCYYDRINVFNTSEILTHILEKRGGGLRR